MPALTQLTTGFPPPSAGLSTSTTAPTPSSAVQRHPQTPLSMGAGTPRPAPLLTQRSGSRPPGPGPGVAPGHAKPGTPMSTSTPGGHPPTRPGSADALAKRGKKRELEEEGSVPPPATAGAIMVGGAVQRRPVVGATPASAGSVPGKSGVPRPHKKPRTVSSLHYTSVPKNIVFDALCDRMLLLTDIWAIPFRNNNQPRRACKAQSPLIWSFGLQFDRVNLTLPNYGRQIQLRLQAAMLVALRGLLIHEVLRTFNGAFPPPGSTSVSHLIIRCASRQCIYLIHNHHSSRTVACNYSCHYITWK